MINFSVLASGSSGNSVYVGTDKTHILIDAGISSKAIFSALEEVGVAAEQLDAILITHEHSDHVKGLKTLAKKLQIPVYATAGTWVEIAVSLGEVERDMRYDVRPGDMIGIGELQIDPFAVSHDCREPVGFAIYEGEEKLCIVTDLGYVSDALKSTLRDANAYVFEANHDVEMLRVGPYPWHLKRRVLGDKGHLSNEAAGEALAEIVTDRTTDVYLAHLSQENNVPSLATLTVENVLKEYDIPVNETIHVHLTNRHRPTSLHTIRSK